MLGDENRMPLHRRLFPIIFRERWRQSGCDKIDGVGTDGVDTLVLNVLTVLVRQFEEGSEFGFFQGGESCSGLVILVLQ